MRYFFEKADIHNQKSSVRFHLKRSLKRLISSDGERLLSARSSRFDDQLSAVASLSQFFPKQVCRTFSYCTNLMRSKDHPLGQYATGCPPFDKEVYGPLWEEAKKD